MNELMQTLMLNQQLKNISIPQRKIGAAQEASTTMECRINK
jgi:hypothetical protein